MNRNLPFLTQKLSRLSVGIGQTVSWLTLSMIIILTINVLASWLFNNSSMFLSESITWMHSANFLLAMGYTLNRDEHVRVDIFYSKMSLKNKAWVNLLGTLLFLLPLCAFILWSSWSFVLNSWNFNEASAEAGGIPATYILKSFLLIMPILLIFEAINQIFSNLQIIIDKPSAKHKSEITTEGAN